MGLRRTDNPNPPMSAGVWRRFAAGFYDLLLLAAVWMLITLIFIVLRGGEAISPGSLKSMPPAAQTCRISTSESATNSKRANPR